jgi:predicted outer membrane repeat protein
MRIQAQVSIFALTGIALLSLLGAPSAHAAVLNVCKQGCAYSTVQSAVDAAASRDTIQIGKGTFFENVSIVDKSLTLSGAGKDFTTLDGGFHDSVIKFNITVASNSLPKVAIVGMTVTHGKANYGGGISVFYARLYLQDVIVTSNRAAVGGGGIVLSGSSSIAGDIVRALITHNIVEGGETNQGTPFGAGGGVYLLDESSLNIRDSSITRNAAPADGGGLYVDYNAAASVTDTTVSDNSAGVSGGGIAAGVFGDNEKGDSATVTISTSTIAHNTAGNDGGGLIVNRGGMTITHCVISGNKAAHDGGGAAGSAIVYASLVFNDSFVVQNAAQDLSGGISARTVQLNNTVVAANTPAD